METNNLRPLLNRVVSVRMDERLFSCLRHRAYVLDISTTTLARRIIRNYLFNFKK